MILFVALAGIGLACGLNQLFAVGRSAFPSALMMFCGFSLVGGLALAFIRIIDR